MGDLQVWPGYTNGVSIVDGLSPSLPPSIGGNSWLQAEKVAHGIISRIQPTIVSEQRRKAVIGYVWRVINGYLGCQSLLGCPCMGKEIKVCEKDSRIWFGIQPYSIPNGDFPIAQLIDCCMQTELEVFPYGSVPLKTYLPDGDIDLTAITALKGQNIEDSLANDVRSVLEAEEYNKAAEFEVKDVQYIHAEVKLIKCLVQNIVVDISFNQLGGLCTLCFLEQVDRHIGRDHIFKRSVLLIKAWCYHESRILGAHHGLISTYALETLVLYVFHLFHSSLHGPLEVLYRFLDYFSKFDWDNYCVSLNGPVRVSSLPEIVAGIPETDGGDLLLSKEFLRDCIERFSVPSRGLESNSRSFPIKHLNIIDPLRENNNLGRSVSKGNFYRIRSAFTYGARKLGQILLLPEESIADEINKFFRNTLHRHISGQRPDVQYAVASCRDSAPFGVSGFSSEPSKSDVETCIDNKTITGLLSLDSSGTVEDPIAEHNGLLCEEINTIRISELEKKQGFQMQSGNEPKIGLNCFTEGNVSVSHVAGDAKDLATSRIPIPRIANESCKSPPLSSKPGTLTFESAHRAPYLYFPQFFPEDGKILNTIPDLNGSRGNLESPVTARSTDGLLLVLTSNASLSEDLYYKDQSLTTNDSSNVFESSSTICPIVGYRERDLAGSNANVEALNGLSELSGDYDSYFNSMQYGQWCHELVLEGPVLSTPYVLRRRSLPRLKRNMFSRINGNGLVRGTSYSPSGCFPLSAPVVSGGFGLEDMPKTRGLGTYFPNMNDRSYKERQSAGRGRNLAPMTQGQLQTSYNSGRVVIPPVANLMEKDNHKPTQAQIPLFNGNVHGKPKSSELFQAGQAVVKGFSHNNGVWFPSERIEFGSLGPVQTDAPLPVKGEGPGHSMDQERVTISYRLKDENDFPPLSV